MKKAKIKTYVLMVSTEFPSYHSKKVEQTHFRYKINCGLCDQRCSKSQPKIHTIRANYPLWEKRIKEVQRGEAILSLRYWSGKAYKSKQIEIYQLTKENGVGIQKIEFNDRNIELPLVDGEGCFLSAISKNDGLLVAEFKEWFKKYDLSKPMAIIHFTDFRY